MELVALYFIVNFWTFLFYSKLFKYYLEVQLIVNTKPIERKVDTDVHNFLETSVYEVVERETTQSIAQGFYFMFIKTFRFSVA